MTQINRIRGKHGNITTDTKEIKTIVKGYFKNVYFIKLETLKYMSSSIHSKLDLERLIT